MLSPAERRRGFVALFAGVAISTTGFLASNTVNGLIAEDLLGAATWSGLPAAASVLGTALGATTLAAVVRRVGPRTGLTVGYGVAMLAVALSAEAILSRQFALFVVSTFVFGAGYGSNRLARYVAADLYPPEQRATQIGWIVWASTLGAVAGPALLAPSRAIGQALSTNGLVGPYLVCIAACAFAAGAMLMAPREMDHSATRVPAASTSHDVPMRVLLGQPAVRVALTAMVSGQFVMVLLMTMTPLHVRHEGHGLGAIGLVIAAHTLGMFALSPITGRLGDRFGRVVLLVGGVGVLVAACTVSALATRGSYAMLVLALFLLGLGWNFGFVGGSALITDAVPPAQRLRVQGLGDGLVWGGGALASIGSGWMLDHAGFTALSVIGGALALAPALPLWKHRHRSSAGPSALTATESA